MAGHLLPRAPHRLRQLHPLLVPPALLRLGTLLERRAVQLSCPPPPRLSRALPPLAPPFVLPPLFVQRRLRVRDRPVAARALLGASGLLLAALGFPLPLFLLERRGGLARLLIVDLAGWLLCSLRRKLSRLGLRFGLGFAVRPGLVVSEIGWQLGMLGERAVRSDRAPEHHARLLHRCRDDVGVVGLLRGALMEQIGPGAPGVQCRLHRGRGDRLVVEAERGLVGLEFSFWFCFFRHVAPQLASHQLPAAPSCHTAPVLPDESNSIRYRRSRYRARRPNTNVFGFPTH